MARGCAGPGPGSVVGHCDHQLEGSPAMGEHISRGLDKVVGGTNLLPIILIVVLFMSRLHDDDQAAAQPAARGPADAEHRRARARVRTTAGMYGTVTSVEDNDDVMVEVAPGVNIRMMRRAVVAVPQDAASPAPPRAAPGGPGASPRRRARAPRRRLEPAGPQHLARRPSASCRGPIDLRTRRALAPPTTTSRPGRSTPGAGRADRRSGARRPRPARSSSPRAGTSGSRSAAVSTSPAAPR